MFNIVKGHGTARSSTDIIILEFSLGMDFG